MKSTSVNFFIIILSLSPLSCFTLGNSVQMGVRAQYDRQYFSAEVQLDPELLDDWVQRVIAQSENAVSYQWPVVVKTIQLRRVLSFYTSGKVAFYSEFENRNGITHNGKYRLFADTLVVYFDDKTDIEKYLYTIYEDRLTITELWKYEYASFTLDGSTSSVYSRYQSE